jgi:hypothetical protein
MSHDHGHVQQASHNAAWLFPTHPAATSVAITSCGFEDSLVLFSHVL